MMLMAFLALMVLTNMACLSYAQRNVPKLSLDYNDNTDPVTWILNSAASAPARWPGMVAPQPSYCVQGGGPVKKSTEYFLILDRIEIDNVDGCTERDEGGNALDADCMLSVEHQEEWPEPESYTGTFYVYKEVPSPVLLGIYYQAVRTHESSLRRLPICEFLKNEQDYSASYQVYIKWFQSMDGLFTDDCGMNPGVYHFNISSLANSLTERNKFPDEIGMIEKIKYGNVQTRASLSYKTAANTLVNIRTSASWVFRPVA